LDRYFPIGALKLLTMIKDITFLFIIQTVFFLIFLNLIIMFDNLISIFSYNLVINVGKRFGPLSIIISTRTKRVKQFCQILNLFGRSLYPMY